MKIVMIASEANPLAKVGGLGDVVYSLAKELAKKGEEVSIILPYYESIKKNQSVYTEYLGTFRIYMSWRCEEANICRCHIDGVTYYLVDNAHYFYRDKIYGEKDDNERFAFFSLACKEIFNFLDYTPDIIHIHDWEVGMLPTLIRENKFDTRLKKTKFVLTIHNPAFQGEMDPYLLGDYYNLPYQLYENGAVRFNMNISTLKAAIMYVDKITTVSPTHAYELLTPEGSKGLNKVLEYRKGDFIGIVNGVDYDEFDPSKDVYIAHHFNQVNFQKMKQENKKELFKVLNIKDTGKPLFALVSRLSYQKGMDIVFDACGELAKRGCNIVILGSGEYKYEKQVEELRGKFPETVAVYIGYNNQLAHKIYASSDFLMMPSLFEPCGISQMIAQKYGTLPIVRRTGGLRDTVICYNGENADVANGFGFDNYSQYDMIRTCLYAFDQAGDAKLMKQLKKNAMKLDNSWDNSANQYLAVYKELLERE